MSGRIARLRRLLIPSIMLWLIGLGGCAPWVHPPGKPIVAPRLTDNYFISADGAKHPLRRWLPARQAPARVLVALHGFNDYSNFFTAPGAYLSACGIVSYAYDQRGFGGAPRRGLWSGVEAYGDDLRQFIGLVRQRHPGLPVYVLGESMGGAVALTAFHGSEAAPVAGLILSAPAVWGWQTMPWYQRGLLWFSAHLTPWLTLTGEGLDITPSDNIEMLRGLGRDPLVIKATRIETIYGLVNLMDAAMVSASQLSVPVLLLYGEKDQIIPKQPTYAMLQRAATAPTPQLTVGLYQNGYHMLLRDLEAEVLWRDIAAWIEAPQTALPSGADRRATRMLPGIGGISNKTTAGGRSASAEPSGL